MFVFLLFEYTNAIVEASSCEIPNESKLGICIKVGQCSAYLQVRNVSNLTAEKVNFLKKVQCGAIHIKDGNEAVEPLVCCPANGQDYRFPSIQFTKFEYRRFLNVTEKFKKKKLKRRIQTVDSVEGFNLGNECGKQVTHRIYGGEIAELDEYPWLALLVYNSSKHLKYITLTNLNDFSHFSDDLGCSGALIDDKHVLTAAHCVQGEGVKSKKGM